MKRILIIILLSVLFGQVMAQTGGQNVFQFLNLTNSARVAALGDDVISVYDDDVNMGLNNPSLLKEDMDDFLSLNFLNYFAGVNYGYTSYTKHYDSIGTFNLSALYANYGQFDYANEFGERDGSTFSANDVSLMMGYGRQYDSLWRIGANVKLIGSFYEAYSSYGMAVDIASTYHNPAKRFTAAFVLRNIGVQFKDYTSNKNQKLPFEAQIGLSHRLEHAPLRFTVTGTNLQKWDLTYFDEEAEPETDPLTGELIENKPPSFFNKAMRHVSIGTEVLLTKNFHLRFGYNYRRRQELKVAARSFVTGLSFGIGLKVKKFRLSYGRSSYHLAGGTNMLTATFNLSDFKN